MISGVFFNIWESAKKASVCAEDTGGRRPLLPDWVKLDLKLSGICDIMQEESSERRLMEG